MKYLVCKFKDNGEMFITTRQAREKMLENTLLIGDKEGIGSFVLKEFDKYSDALKYKADIELVNKTINRIT